MDGAAERRVAHNREYVGTDARDYRSHPDKACRQIGNFRLPRGVSDKCITPRQHSREQKILRRPTEGCGSMMSAPRRPERAVAWMVPPDRSIFAPMARNPAR